LVKIALIGAGSQVFSRRLITDILSFPDFRDTTTIALMDVDEARLDLITAFAKKLVRQYRSKTKVESTTDRSIALDDADYVTTTLRQGGPEVTWYDKAIPAKYGVHHSVGDTIGPAGVFYGLRHIPLLLSIAHDMEDRCPDALLMNYTNPMAMICWALNDYTQIKNIGLCHSVQGTAELLASYLGAPIDEVSYWVAGINHMAWFLKLHWRGKDAYPLLAEKFKEPEIYTRGNRPDTVRVLIFKAFGYFVTESSRHMSEYVPYFRKRPELFEQFKVTLHQTYLASEPPTEPQRRPREEETRRLVESAELIPTQRTNEYCSYIIHSIEHGNPYEDSRRVNVNVMNTGLITNLPPDTCVEVPCLVDTMGVHPCYVGNLPPQCAALNRTNINVQELGMKAAVEKDKTLAYQAIFLDPLTSAVLTLAETRKMVDEMFEAQAKLGYLTDFK
jgi:alpha-galactosidase